MEIQIQGYKNLKVWQKSLDLVTEVYKMTQLLPDAEKFGLISQIRRASVSIPSNIAEGSRRSGNKEFRHFLFIAYGSGAELETQFEIIKRLQFLKSDMIDNADSLLAEVMKMLNALLKKI